MKIILIIFFQNNNKDLFSAVKKEIGKFKIIHTSRILLRGIKDKKISNYDSLLSSKRKYLYIEQKLGFTFNEIILLDNGLFLINLSGLKN